MSDDHHHPLSEKRYVIHAQLWLDASDPERAYWQAEEIAKAVERSGTKIRINLTSGAVEIGDQPKCEQCGLLMHDGTSCPVDGDDRG